MSAMNFFKFVAFFDLYQSLVRGKRVELLTDSYWETEA
jgi:hypothetical protein